MENNEQHQPVPQPSVSTQETSGGINLLPEVAEKEIKAGVYKRKVNLAALVALGAIGIVIIGILVLQGALAIQANIVKDQTAQAENQIRQNQAVEIKAKATKEKLDKIEQLLTTAIPSSTFVTEVTKATAATPPVKITSLNISENGEAFVDGLAANSEAYKQWIANLTSDSSKDYFSKINAVSLTGNPSEGYKFSFKLTFLKKGVYQLDGQ